MAGSDPEIAPERAQNAPAGQNGLTTRTNQPVTAPVRRERCRALATAEVTRAELAQRWGVSRPTVTIFARRHAAEIDAIRRELDDEFAGLWIAQKELRLAAYQHEYEQAAGWPGPEMTRARTAVLHTAAEELGQLPGRGGGVVMPVVHTIVAVSLDDLR